MNQFLFQKSFGHTEFVFENKNLRVSRFNAEVNELRNNE